MRASHELGAKPTPKCAAAAASKPALVEELAPDHRLGAAQLLGVVGRGRLVGLEQPGALTLRAPRAGAGVLVAQLDAEPGGQLLDRLLEGEVLDALEEVDDVAADLAAEAVVETLGGGDVEAGAALLVERAEALEAAAPGGAQGDVVADDLGDAGHVAHPCDVVVADAAGHARESRWRREGLSGAMMDLWNS